LQRIKNFKRWRISINEGLSLSSNWEVGLVNLKALYIFKNTYYAIKYTVAIFYWDPIKGIIICGRNGMGFI